MQHEPTGWDLQPLVAIDVSETTRTALQPVLKAYAGTMDWPWRASRPSSSA
jgi:hypothetical protein